MAAKIDTAAAHLRASRFIEAANECEAILKQSPEQPDALHFLGLAKWQIGGNADEAAGLIERAMAKAPNQSAMHHNLAAILASAGNLERGETHYRKAIELNPDYAEAYFNLSGVIKLKSDDPLIPGMKAIYAKPDVSDLNREFICYALSKTHDDIGMYEEAFHFALEGSRLRNPEFDIDGFQRAIVELRQEISAQALKPASGRGNPTQAPVFIVGMPRSGTTLIEQILSRHTEVFAGGEMQLIGSFHQAMQGMARKQLGYKGADFGFWKQIPDELINSAGAGILQYLKSRAGSMPFRFTDKMPRNAFHLGLIALVFPNARIIHVRRHPLDTCVSCFMQRFRDGQEFTFRLDWLGQYYRSYSTVMDHWRDVLPLRMHEVRYENLVADPEAGAREIISFAGLEWQDVCADPSAGDREIRTASRWQVRQPVYKTSVERWTRYQDYLDPLIDALGGMEWIQQQASS